MIQKIRAYNKFHVTEKRNQHIERVVEMSNILAGIFQLSDGEREKLIVSAYLHDSTKDFSNQQLRMILKKENPQLLLFPEPIWHSFASAVLGRDYFKITDGDIFNAVFYHTIGHYTLDKVGQLLFLADYIEVGRDFPCAIEVREIALKGDLEGALLKTLQHTITYLKQTDKPVAFETQQFYNHIERSI